MFSAVIGINDIRECAKFQFGHLSGWYFTDWSVNSNCPVASVHFTNQSINNTALPKSRSVTWLECILQTGISHFKAGSVKYTLVTWSNWSFVVRHYFMILVPCENFKSIGLPYHSKWYSSNEEFYFTDWSVKYQPDRWPTWNFVHRLMSSIPITGENFKSKAFVIKEI